MKINIKTTNITLTDNIKNYITKKIGSLSKFFKNYPKDSAEAFVEVGLPSKHHKKGNVFQAEVNIDVLGKLYRSQCTTSDIYAAIDEVKNELQVNIKRSKEKTLTKERRKARSIKKSRSLSPYSRFRKK